MIDETRSTKQPWSTPELKIEAGHRTLSGTGAIADLTGSVDTGTPPSS